MSAPRNWTLESLKARCIVNDRECWLWQGWSVGGYGAVEILGVRVLVHRLSFKLSKGDPEGLMVCHDCDTPPCINPSHLFLGTNADNMADMKQKGRGRGPLGVKRDEEFREAVRARMLGNKNGIGNRSRLGQSPTEETRIRMKESQRLRRLKESEARDA